MKFAAVCAILSIAFTGAVANPVAGFPKPPKPEKPTINIHNPQVNVCGNGVQAYCCNNEALHGGYVDCTALSQSNVCSTTIVCCNAQDSVQSCVGNVNIQNKGW